MVSSEVRLSGSDAAPSVEINVGDAERTASVVVGGLIVLYGLSKLSLTTTVAAVAGVSLLYRGLTGKCGIYQALDMSSACDRDEKSRGERNKIPSKGAPVALRAATGTSPSQAVK